MLERSHYTPPPPPPKPRVVPHASAHTVVHRGTTPLLPHHAEAGHAAHTAPLLEGALHAVERFAADAKPLSAHAARTHLESLQHDFKKVKSAQELHQIAQRADDLQIGMALNHIKGPEAKQAAEFATRVNTAARSVDHLNQDMAGVHSRSPHAQAAAMANLLAHPAAFRQDLEGMKGLKGTPLLGNLKHGIHEMAKTATPAHLAKLLAKDPDISHYPPDMATNLASLQGTQSPHLQAALTKVATHLLERPGQVTFKEVEQNPALGKLLSPLQQSQDPAVRQKLQTLVNHWADRAVHDSFAHKEKEKGAKQGLSHLESTLKGLAQSTGLGPTLAKVVSTKDFQKGWVEHAYQAAENRGKSFFDNLLDDGASLGGSILNGMEDVGSFIGKQAVQFGKGAFAAAKGTFQAVKFMAQHPLTALKGMGSLVLHPGRAMEMAKQMFTAIGKKGAAYALGYAAANALVAVTGAGSLAATGAETAMKFGLKLALKDGAKLGEKLGVKALDGDAVKAGLRLVERGAGAVHQVANKVSPYGLVSTVSGAMSRGIGEGLDSTAGDASVGLRDALRARRDTAKGVLKDPKGQLKKLGNAAKSGKASLKDLKDGKAKAISSAKNDGLKKTVATWYKVQRDGLKEDWGTIKAQFKGAKADRSNGLQGISEAVKNIDVATDRAGKTLPGRVVRRIEKPARLVNESAGMHVSDSVQEKVDNIFKAHLGNINRQVRTLEAINQAQMPTEEGESVIEQLTNSLGI